MEKFFEYKMYILPVDTRDDIGPAITMELNTLGSQGWELVAGHASWLIFKKQKTEPGNPPLNTSLTPNLIREKILEAEVKKHDDA